MAFEILARLGLNASGFNSGLKRAESAGVAFGKNLRSNLAGAFSAAAVTAFTRSVIAAADRIGDLSDQTGLTKDSIQELIAIASKRGVEFSTLQTFVERLREARREAIAGKEDIASVFSQLGISMAELTGTKDPMELLQKFSRGFSQFDEESRNAIAGAIGGLRTGPKMSAVLEAIGKGETSGEIKMSDRQIEAASRFDERSSSLMRQVKAVFSGILFPKPQSEQFKDAIIGAGLGPEIAKRDEWFISGIERAADKVFVPFVKAQKEEVAKDEEPPMESPELRPYQANLSSLQRIGEEIKAPGTSSIDRQQLTQLEKMEKHLRELKNNTGGNY